jgi:hypothetical protein
VIDMIDFLGGRGARVAPYIIHKVVRGITTQPYGSYKNEFFKKNIYVVLSANCVGGYH